MPLLIFIVLPILELTLFIKIGEETGVLFVIAEIFLSAMIGMAIVRHQGFSTLQRVNEKLQKGESSAIDVISAFLLALGGLLLILPGFLTDSFGALLLIPPIRGGVAKYMLKKGGGQSVHFYGFSQRSNKNHGDIYEGEYSEEQPERKTINTFDRDESGSQDEDEKK